jgi:hypothetical protein
MLPNINPNSNRYAVLSETEDNDDKMSKDSHDTTTINTNHTSKLKQNKGILKSSTEQVNKNNRNQINNTILLTNLNYTFNIYVRAIKNNNETNDFTRLQCIRTVLQAFQVSEGSRCLKGNNLKGYNLIGGKPTYLPIT